MLGLSQTAEYALRAVVYLAGRASVPRTTLEVAERTGVPTSYLAKILLSLTRAGILTSQRGAGGGFVLAEPDRSLLDVIHAVDPGRRGADPAGRPEACVETFAELQRRLLEASAAVEDVLRSVRIGDLVAETADYRGFQEAS